MKPSDSKALPMCHTCHALSHAKGERTWWGNKLEAAQDLAKNIYIFTGNDDMYLQLANRFRR